MEKTLSHHDRYFRAAMSDLRVAADFFAHYLPATIKAQVDLTTLKLRQESLIDEQLKLGITDILYSVNIQQQAGYIYLLVEHQSTADYWMPFRIVKYSCAIMEQHIKQTQSKVLPLVMPIVFYHGNTTYPYSTDILDLFAENKALAETVLFKPFQLVDIGKIADEEIRQHQWSGIMEFMTKHIFARDILPYLRPLARQLKAIEELGGHDYIIRTFKYMWLAGAIKNEQQFVQIIEEELSPIIGGEIMTLAEIYMEKGRQAGLQTGLETGLQTGVQKSKNEIAKKLLLKGLNTTDIAEVTGLSLQEIELLQAEKSDEAI